MSWLRIVGYEREKEILQKAVLEGKLPNAYCFSGTEGVGKEAMAIQFAKTVNCENPLIQDGKIDSCDKCYSCRKIDDFSHDNFSIVFPLPASSKPDSKSSGPLANFSDDQIDIIKDELHKKSQDNYYKISVPNAKQIKISSIRDIKRKLTLSASSKGRRVVLICEAEKMTKEAANSFLKTLEEPHPNITIILSTSKPEYLLQTIMSRCQQINFGPMSEDMIKKALIERNGLSPENASIAAAFGQGSYRRALNSVSGDIQELRMIMVEMLRIIVKKRFKQQLIEKVEELEKMKDKNKLETSLMLLMLWLRDAYRMQQTHKQEGLINADDKNALVNFVNYFQNADLGKALSLTEKAITRIHRNVNVHLILLSLFTSIREILLEKK